MPDPVLGVISQTQNKWIVFSYIYESKKQKKRRGASQLKEMLSWLAFCFYDKHHRLSCDTKTSMVSQLNTKKKNYKQLQNSASRLDH